MASRVSGPAVLLTPSLLIQTASLHADVVDVIERSRDVCWWARQVCAGAVRSRRRMLRGGAPDGLADTAHPLPAVHEPGASDLRLVMVALWREGLCMTCLAARTGVPTARIDEMFAALGRLTQLSRSVATCEGCSAATEIVTLV